MRILEFCNVFMYRLIEFHCYTICGIEYYRNYSRFYWRNIFQESKKRKVYSKEDVIKIVEKSRETGLTAEFLLLTFKSE